MMIYSIWCIEHYGAHAHVYIYIYQIYKYIQKTPLKCIFQNLDTPQCVSKRRRPKNALKTVTFIHQNWERTIYLYTVSDFKKCEKRNPVEKFPVT